MFSRHSVQDTGEKSVTAEALLAPSGRITMDACSVKTVHAQHRSDSFTRLYSLCEGNCADHNLRLA
jgi:hypothetical protein